MRSPHQMEYDRKVAQSMLRADEAWDKYVGSPIYGLAVILIMIMLIGVSELGAIMINNKEWRPISKSANTLNQWFAPQATVAAK